jgi:hypothetical protein
MGTTATTRQGNQGRTEDQAEPKLTRADDIGARRARHGGVRRQWVPGACRAPYRLIPTNAIGIR